MTEKEIFSKTTANSSAKNLTKREYFAAMAMQGILENKVPHYQLAEKAVTMADALIKALNESQP